MSPPVRRGFSLLEVLVALSILALVVVVLGSAYLNVLIGYEAVSRGMVINEDVAFARQLVLREPDRKKLEQGGEFETAGGRRARWSVEITADALPDVFKVAFTCEISEPGRAEPDKVAQQFLLAAREAHDLAASPQFALLHVEDTIAELCLLDGGRGGAVAAEKVAHAQQKFLRLERFHQIIVTACREALDAVGALGAGGEHQDRNVVARAAERFRKADATLPRHHHIEDDEVEDEAAHAFARFRRVGGGGHAIAMGDEIGVEQGPDAAVVIDHENVERLAHAILTAPCGGRGQSRLPLPRGFRG